jgi:hypothetical protein
MFVQILQTPCNFKNLQFLTDLAQILNCGIRFVYNFSINFSSGQDTSATNVLDQRLAVSSIKLLDPQRYGDSLLQFNDQRYHTNASEYSIV